MLLVVRHVIRAGLLDPEAPRQEIKGIQAWSGMTTVMFELSIPAGSIAGRWIMIVWPVGYLGLRFVAECCIRENRKTARFP